MELRALYLIENLSETNWKKSLIPAAVLAAAGIVGVGASTLSKKFQITRPEVKTSEPEAKPTLVPEPEPILEPEPEPESESEPESKAELNTGYVADYVARNEGIVNRIYDDDKKGLAKRMTIGVGHFVYDGNAKQRIKEKQISRTRQIFNKLFGKSVDFGAILRGKAQLSDDQAKKLFAYDLDEHIKRARKRFPQLDKYPSYLQAALVDSTYRGEGSHMPKTDALIRANRWVDAAEEYLDYGQYKKADELNIPGVRTRMEQNRDAMLRYARESSR